MAANIPGTVQIVIDLTEVVELYRNSKLSEAEILEEASNRYLKYLRNRFVAASAGGGTWKGLSPKTVDRKRQRIAKYGLSTNPSWILRETNQLVNNITTEPTKQGFRIGYLTRRLHKPTKDRKKTRITIAHLAEIHQTGDGVVARPIIVEPNKVTMRLMVDAVTKKLMPKKRVH